MERSSAQFGTQFRANLQEQFRANLASLLGVNISDITIRVTAGTSSQTAMSALEGNTTELSTSRSEKKAFCWRIFFLP